MTPAQLREIKGRMENSDKFENQVELIYQDIPALLAHISELSEKIGQLEAENNHLEQTLFNVVTGTLPKEKTENERT